MTTDEAITELRPFHDKAMCASKHNWGDRISYDVWLKEVGAFSSALSLEHAVMQAKAALTSPPPGPNRE